MIHVSVISAGDRTVERNNQPVGKDFGLGGVWLMHGLPSRLCKEFSSIASSFVGSFAKPRFMSLLQSAAQMTRSGAPMTDTRPQSPIPGARPFQTAPIYQLASLCRLPASAPVNRNEIDAGKAGE